MFVLLSRMLLVELDEVSGMEHHMGGSYRVIVVMILPPDIQKRMLRRLV
jgi:hypothetical protein